MKYDCVGIGIFPLDIFVFLKEYPKSNQTVKALETFIQSGGPTGNAMSTLAKFGRNTAIIGNVGNDQNAETVISEFKKDNICTNGLNRIKNKPHTVAYIWVDTNNGNRTIAVSQELPKAKKLSKKQKEIILSSKFVLIDGTEPHISYQALLLAKKNKIPTMLDAGNISEAPMHLVKLADYVIGSEFFAKGITPKRKISEKLKYIYDRNKKLVAITLGSKGSIIYDGKKIIKQKAYSIDHVVDTTGAGDIFHGAFIEGILNKWSIKKTAEFASITAGLKCTKKGGKKGIPTIKTVLRKIKKNV